MPVIQALGRLRRGSGGQGRLHEIPHLTHTHKKVIYQIPIMLLSLKSGGCHFFVLVAFHVLVRAQTNVR